MSNDWMPSVRLTRAALSKTWVTLVESNAAELRIPEEDVTELDQASDELNGMLNTPPEQRASAYNAMLKEADDRLIAIMRKIKKRYLFMPPLSINTYLTFGLTLPDTEPTPIPVPQGTATGSITYLGGQELQLNITHVQNISVEAKAYYGFKIFYDVLPTNEPAPENGKHLRQNIFTRRKRHVFRFEPEDKGKTAYFCIVYENGKGERGPWGEVFSALIP